MRYRRLLTFFALLFLSGLALGLWWDRLWTRAHYAVEQESPAAQKLKRLVGLIENYYVDQVDTEAIVDQTIEGILSQLDPHSQYLPAEVAEAAAEQMKGSFVGIGVNFYVYKDSIAVIKTVPGGPSASAGLKSGDRILWADQDTLFGKGLTSNQIVGTLKGVEGSPLTLGVYRKANDSLFEAPIKRGSIPLVSVDGAYMVTPGLGYMKINRFSATTYTEFKAALTGLKKKGAQSLILDLRGNPGGFMEPAIQVVDDFLPQGAEVVSTQSKDKTIERVTAKSGGAFENKPVYVLVDEQTASAAEIIAGALQDNDLGTIIGRRTFGKGLVQQEMPLGDGSSIRLTTAYYFTPTGRSIQKPYKNGGYEDLWDRYHSGELKSMDSIKVADSLKYKTPKGKVVYGGGGIIPDVFVPIADDGLLGVEQLEAYGLVDYFVFEQMDQARGYWLGLNEQNWGQKPTIPEGWIDDFEQYLKNQGMEWNWGAPERDALELALKASAAGQRFGETAALKIRGSADPMIALILAHKPTSWADFAIFAPK